MSQKQFRNLSPASKAYISIVVAAGAITVAEARYSLLAVHMVSSWLVLAVLTLLSGSFTLKLPSLPATISVSETFVFTSVLLFGAPAGTLTVALDALVISCWSYRRGDPLYKITFNLFALPLTIWIAAQVFSVLPNVAPLYLNRQIEVTELLWPLLVLAVVYFLLNSWVISFAIALEQRLSAFQIWREHFVVLSLNYFGGASVAALLINYTRDVDYKYVALIVPLLVVLYLTFSWQLGRVADANRHLIELNKLYMSTIETLAMAIDAKDQITHGHIRRVQTYAVDLAKRIGITDAGLIRAVEAAALLHDMGKLAVPEYILNKPGPLTPAEFDKMKLHASVGAEILSAIDFPYPVVPIVRHHHENWDGSGYPDGIAGTNIPIGARVLSVVDCFDALTSDRPYRPRLSDADAINILMERRGSMYDPLIVDTFVTLHAEAEPTLTSPGAHLPLGAVTRVPTSSVTTLVALRPLDEITASTEEMLTLFDLARVLTSEMSFQDAGDVIAKHLRRLVPSSLAVFFLYDLDTDQLVVAHASGEHADLVAGARLGVGERLSGWVAAHRQTIRNADPVLDWGEAARAMVPRFRSALSAPLVFNGGLVGVLSLYSTNQDSFTDDHQRIVDVVSRQVSSIVKNAADSDRNKTSALRDHVTGLPNAEHLLKFTRAHVSHDPIREPLSVILLDVDNLAEVNKQYGYEAGDGVLTRIGLTIRRCLRTADLLFRYRDDEFLVVLLQTDRETSVGVGRRIADALEREASSLGATPFSVAISLASGPRDGSGIEELIAVANVRMRNSMGIPKTTSHSTSIH
jgi:diguanylate cyclase (GGDEF)-like protein/putative nucleotidyltransferase with HDIG domain